MSKKRRKKNRRKKNPGSALWLVFGLAAGGGIAYAFSQGAFDNLLDPKAAKKKDKKSGKKQKLPPPTDEPGDRFNNGLTFNSDCTKVVAFDEEVLATQVTQFVVSSLEADNITGEENGQLQGEEVIDVAGLYAAAYLDQGEGTEMCDWASEPSLADLTKFKASALVIVTTYVLVLMNQLGVISDESFLSAISVILEESQLLGLTEEYMISVGWPVKAQDASILG